jgi:hypothetical protein
MSRGWLSVAPFEAGLALNTPVLRGTLNPDDLAP